MLKQATTLNGIIPIGKQVPGKFSLYQNFPNPFNPTTSIKFDIPKESIVKITIFDALGRETAVPVNESLKAGSYSVDFDASRLASGIYYYKIEAGNYIESKKMVLLK